VRTLLVCLLALGPLAAQSLPFAEPLVPVANNLLPSRDYAAIHPVSNVLPREIVERPRGRNLFAISVVTLLAATAADFATSWGRRELNPMLNGGGAMFGGHAAAVKAGTVGVSLTLQWLTLRHNPNAYRGLAYTNFAVAGAMGGVAAHNASLPR